MSLPPSSRLEPIRLGIAGLGSFGTLHARTAAAITEAQLTALVDPRAERLHALSKELPHVPSWSDLDAALDRGDTQAWVVATSTESHVAVARKILEAGKAVLVEKPLALDLAEAESLAPLVRDDPPNLMLGHVVLFSSEFQQLLDETARRGPIRYIDAVRHRPVTTLQTFPGESPFHLTMVHDLYLVLALMARAEPSRLSAQIHRTAEGRCDLALARLEWAVGAIASLTASFMTPPGMAHDGFDRLEIFGDGWAARLELNPRPLTLWDDRARWPLAHEIPSAGSAATGMLAEELRCFCRILRGLQSVPAGASYDDALTIQRWIERLHLSTDARDDPSPPVQ